MDWVVVVVFCVRIHDSENAERKSESEKITDY